MSFQPVLPLPGLAGWALLNQTRGRQEETFLSTGEIARDIAYFRENISSIKTSEELISDRRLLKVALGAFGLSEDLDKRAFVRKVLDEGTDDPAAFANRMVDKRYAKLAETFGFGNIAGRQTNRSGFTEKLVSAYQTRSFEIAVGTSNESFRLAMTFEREIVGIAAADTGSIAGWFSILGNLPLRQLAVDSLGLSDAFTSMSVDRQAETLKERMSSVYGVSSVADFADPDIRAKVTRGYLARSPGGTTDFGTSPSAAALTLLSGSTGTSASEAIFLALYG